MNYAATFFGHKDTPKEAEPTLRATLLDLIINKNVSVFYVGNNGNFDAMVRNQLKDLSVIYPIICICVIRIYRIIQVLPPHITLNPLILHN